MTPTRNPTATDMSRALDLVAHPEGGFYRETFRDPATDVSGRARSTAIYFLLPQGIISRWHRIDAAEVWHWYPGFPLELAIERNERSETIRLGGDVLNEEQPQAVVPAGTLQQAASLGAWTLVGCTVAPGFLFEHFEIVEPADPAARR